MATHSFTVRHSRSPLSFLSIGNKHDRCSRWKSTISENGDNTINNGDDDVNGNGNDDGADDKLVHESNGSNTFTGINQLPQRRWKTAGRYAALGAVAAGVVAAGFMGVTHSRRTASRAAP